MTYDIFENTGKIVKNVNTTVDVGEDEIMTQAKKFRNNVDKNGRPPTLETNASNVKNMGLSRTSINENKIKTKSTYKNLDEAVYDGNIGAMEVMRFFMLAGKNETKLADYVKSLTERGDPDATKLAWRIIQDYMGVKLKGPGFGNE